MADQLERAHGLRNKDIENRMTTNFTEDATLTGGTRALLEAKYFLPKLVDIKRQPPEPKSVREHAKHLLQHCPNIPDPGLAHKALTAKFGTVPSLRRVGL